MKKDFVNTLAQENLKALKRNPYPGRGLIIGLDETGTFFIQVYWIMGRSQNSRNRIFVSGPKGLLKTATAVPEEVKNPSLIIYQAMGERYNLYAVSNGAQTETILRSNSLYEAMLMYTYEPDPPNFTPRISAVCTLFPSPLIEMSLLRKSPFGEGCERHTYQFEQFKPGIGHCLTTYIGDGNPLPSFSGEPYLFPLKGDIDDITDCFWEALNEDNRVSLAVKVIHIKSGGSTLSIRNKYSK
jgi:hypothetical protein